MICFPVLGTDMAWHSTMISEKLRLRILDTEEGVSIIHSTLTTTLRGDGVKGFVFSVGIIHSFYPLAPMIVHLRSTSPSTAHWYERQLHQEDLQILDRAKQRLVGQS